MAPQETIEVRIPALPTWLQRLLMLAVITAMQMVTATSTRNQVSEDMRVELEKIKVVQPFKDDIIVGVIRRVEALEKGYRSMDKKLDALLAKEGITIREDE